MIFNPLFLKQLSVSESTTNTSGKLNTSNYLFADIIQVFSNPTTSTVLPENRAIVKPDLASKIMQINFINPVTKSNIDLAGLLKNMEGIIPQSNNLLNEVKTAKYLPKGEILNSEVSLTNEEIEQLISFLVVNFKTIQKSNIIKEESNYTNSEIVEELSGNLIQGNDSKESILQLLKDQNTVEFNIPLLNQVLQIKITNTKKDSDTNNVLLSVKNDSPEPIEGIELFNKSNNLTRLKIENANNNFFGGKELSIQDFSTFNDLKTNTLSSSIERLLNHSQLEFSISKSEAEKIIANYFMKENSGIDQIINSIKDVDNTELKQNSSNDLFGVPFNDKFLSELKSESTDNKELAKVIIPNLKEVSNEEIGLSKTIKGVTKQNPQPLETKTESIGIKNNLSSEIKTLVNTDKKTIAESNNLIVENTQYDIDNNIKVKEDLNIESQSQRNKTSILQSVFTEKKNQAEILNKTPEIQLKDIKDNIKDLMPEIKIANSKSNYGISDNKSLSKLFSPEPNLILTSNKQVENTQFPKADVQKGNENFLITTATSKIVTSYDLKNEDKLTEAVVKDSSKKLEVIEEKPLITSNKNEVKLSESNNTGTIRLKVSDKINRTAFQNKLESPEKLANENDNVKILDNDNIIIDTEDNLMSENKSDSKNNSIPQNQKAVLSEKNNIIEKDINDLKKNIKQQTQIKPDNIAKGTEQLKETVKSFNIKNEVKTDNDIVENNNRIIVTQANRNPVDIEVIVDSDLNGLIKNDYQPSFSETKRIIYKDVNQFKGETNFIAGLDSSLVEEIEQSNNKKIIMSKDIMNVQQNSSAEDELIISQKIVIKEEIDENRIVKTQVPLKQKEEHSTNLEEFIEQTFEKKESNLIIKANKKIAHVNGELIQKETIKYEQNPTQHTIKEEKIVEKQAVSNNTHENSSNNQNRSKQNENQENNFANKYDDTIRNISRSNAVSFEKDDIKDSIRTLKVIEVIKEISKFIEKKEPGSVSFNLQPEHLGKLKISIDVVDNIAKAIVEVQSDEVRKLIENNMNQLTNSLNNNGIQLSSMKVYLNYSDQKPSRGSFAQKNRTNRREEKTEELSSDFQKKLGYNTYEYLV
jgi:flagellar hook-length control protein FliK